MIFNFIKTIIKIIMKHIYIISFIFIVPSLFAQNSSVDNFYTNGDFENGTTGFTSTTTLTHTEETAIVNPYTNSTKSIKLVTGTLLDDDPNTTGQGNNEESNSAAVFRPQNGNQVLGGGDKGDFRFSFWAKSDVADQLIQVRYVAKGGTYIKSWEMTFTDTNWHKVQFTKADVPADKEVQFQIYFSGADMSGQTFYIDDMKVSMGQLDTDMDLSFYDKFRTGAGAADVPNSATTIKNALWTSQSFGNGNQVSTIEYSTAQKTSGTRSLKVTTNNETTSEKKAVVLPKDSNDQRIRFQTEARPAIGGSSDETNYPEIKYTFSVKVFSNTANAEFNANYKIAGLGERGALLTLQKDTWTTFTKSYIFDRADVITTDSDGNPIVKSLWQHIPALEMNTPNAVYYFDDINITWQEWDEATMSVPIQDYSKVAIYPNPASQFITIDGVDDNANVDIYDISGKNVKSFMIKSKSQQMDISDLVKGIYLARLNNEQTTLFIKK
jgi:hypothetical protein